MKIDMKYLSFSSPKGGVGRTLTLCNCAKIYAKGSAWAGIEPAICLLADLDFHAPGIHHYDFTSLEPDSNCFYTLGDTDCLTYDEMLAKLDHRPFGLLFLLSEILKDDRFGKFVTDAKTQLSQNILSESAIYNDLNFAIQGLLKEDAYRPSKHLIKVHYESNDIFILPAASPNHADFYKLVYGFDWSKFNENFGLLVLDGIFIRTVAEIKRRTASDKPIRILVDQQAGVSLPSAMNRTLADASILVSGLNLQNKSGLKGMINNYCETYAKNPWVVLNQYKFRKIALKNSLDLTYHQTSPHEEFRKIDNEIRIKFIEALCDDNPSLRKHIFLTEFLNDAVQREHFYSDRDLATGELTRMLVGIEKNFNNEPPVIGNKPRSHIIVIGERVFAGNSHSGPLNGLFTLLRDYYSDDSTIIALAVTHEDIVTLSQQGKLKGHLYLKDKHVTDLGSLKTGIYNFTVGGDGREIVRLKDIDLISYPHHLKTSLVKKRQIRSFSENEFVRMFAISDTLNGTSVEYFKENILRWNEYVDDKESNTIDSVPLFVNFQLLAYRKDLVYDKEDFKMSYRTRFKRDFEGFRHPQDLIDFSILTKDTAGETDNVLLCSNPDDIAMWYEWQTIFSLFYNKTGKPPETDSISSYVNFLAGKEALNATMDYINLRRQADQTSNGETRSSYDWDRLLEQFYVKVQKGLIFIWPDAIPISRSANDDLNADRHDNNIIYQVPPSFHLFEECWQFSIVDKNHKKEEINTLLSFMNFYLTADAQLMYTHNGGLPVHKQVLSSLDVWNRYPFIPPIWKVYSDPFSDRTLTKRDSFPHLYEAGKLINNCLAKAYDKPNTTNADFLQIMIEEFQPLVRIEQHNYEGIK